MGHWKSLVLFTIRIVLSALKTLGPRHLEPLAASRTTINGTG